MPADKQTAAAMAKRQKPRLPVLGYWNIRGLAQPIRFLLAYLNVEYEEKVYEFGPPPDFNTNEFRCEKFKLGLDFPNVPYWIDDTIKLTQSKAILKYLARTYSPTLLSPTKELEAKYDQLEHFVRDVWEGISETLYFYSEETAKTFEIEQKLKLEQLSMYLGNNKWILGENLSYIDFLLYEVLIRQLAFDSSWIEKYTNLIDYIKAFEAIPAIARHLETSPFVTKPFTGPSAKKLLSPVVTK